MFKIFNRYPWLGYFLKIFAFLLFAFSTFRLILLITNFGEIHKIHESTFNTLFEVFVMGVRFDLAIIGYFVILPFFLLFLLKLFKINYTKIYLINSFIILLFSISGFLISIADIPYYNHFGSRITIAALKWFDSLDFVVNMIIEEPRFLVFLIPLALMIALSYYLLIRFAKNAIENSNTEPVAIKNYFKEIGLFIVVFLVIFLGIRGRIEEKSPIRVSTAYITAYPFFNQLGLNANFTFFQSILNSSKKEAYEIKLVDFSNAIKFVENDLQAEYDSLNNIFYRQITNSPSRKFNVIFILMEGISGDNFTIGEKNQKLMPFLDSLKDHSLFFPNFYSAGIHTNNGIFATQTSLPILFIRNIMTEMVNIPDFGGIASILKSNGYSTNFSITHDDEFDGMKGFLIANGYQKVVAKKDYPSKMVLSTMGVPDHFLFDYSIPIIKEIKKNGTPLLYTYLTGTNHAPYNIPNGTNFKPKSKDIKLQTIEFTDWSIRQFLNKISKEKWFDSTIVVITSDHGSFSDKTYDIPLAYLHIPLIIYSPKLIQSRVVEAIGSQIDIMPTIMNILGIDYINQGLGIDLLTQTRKYLYFCYDEIGGVISDSLLYIYNPQERNKLHLYKTNDQKDYSFIYKNEFNEMEKYFKHYITANYYYYKRKQE